MAEHNVQINLEIVAKQALASLQQIEKSTQSVEKTFKGVGASLISLNQGLELAGKAYRAMSGLVGRAITEATQQEEAEILLNEALVSKGKYTDQVSAAMIKYADSMAKATVFQDDQIISVQKQLVQMGVEVSQIEKVTQAVADLASAKRMDLSSAADLVGKSIVSSTNALSRYGLEIGKVSGNTERATALTEKIASVYGGAAAAQTKTFAGQIAQLNKAFGEMLESFGMAIIKNPEVTKSIGNLTSGLNILAGYVGQATSFLLNLATKGIDFVIKQMFLLGYDIDIMIQRFINFGASILNFMMPGFQALLTATATVIGVFNKDLAESIDNQKIKLQEYAAALQETSAQKIATITAEQEMFAQDNEIKLTQENDYQTRSLAQQQEYSDSSKAITEDKKKWEEQKEASFSKTWEGYLFRRKKFEETTNQERVQNMMSTLNSISTLSTAHNKGLQVIGKAAAVSSATIDGIVAVQKALASAPPPFNFALAGLVGVATAANIAKIVGVQLAEGGIVMPRNGGTQALIGEAGKAEAVIPLDDSRARDALGGMGTTVIIQGNVIGDDEHIDKLVVQIRDAVRYRNASLG